MKKLFTLRTFLPVLFSFMITGTMKTYAIGDAGVQSVLTPSSPVCKGTSSVSVIIKNYGALTISTATVNWRVNGVAQPAFNFVGSIPNNSQDTVTIGNYNFNSGSYNINAWTSNPNGSADTDQSNDSANAAITVSPKLTGTYTIAGTTPDFPTFKSAVNALIANGICGPVIFNIRPYTDTMQCVIPQIVGADSLTTILFQSENGDSTSVVLTYPSQDTLINNHLISLDGADFITFKSLTLQRTGVLANAHVIEFTNNATHNTVTNCRLIGATGTTNNSLAAILYSSNITTYNDSMNTITNNLIKNGSLGIYMNGISNLSLEYNTIIKFNTFVDQYSKGIQNTCEGATIIEGNTFSTTSTYAGYAAIYLDRSYRVHKIIKNKILGVPGTGMYFVDCTAQSGVHGIIANNFIQSNDSAGISMVNGSYQDVVYNSILMTGSTPSFAALLMRGGGVGKVVKNNILANTGGGYSYVVSDSAVFGIQKSDHNNLYKSGGSFIGSYNGTNVTTLANWVSASNRDSNSVNLNPSFVSVGDLHVASIAMDDRGMPVNNVTDDIDGQTRSNVTPDIGADEYTSISRTVGVTGIISPVDSTCGSLTTSVKIIVSNTGGNPESNFNVVTQITGALTTTLSVNHTATLAPGQSDTITYSSTINTAVGGVYFFKSYTSLAVDDVHANDTLEFPFHLFAPPTTPTVTPANVCGPGTDTLTASSTDTLRWYSAATGGTLLSTGATFIPPVASATTTYYVAAKSACEGPRTPVALTVLPVPTVNLGPDVNVNQGNSTTIDAGPGFTSYLWTPGLLTTRTISVNTQGCYNVKVTNSSGCEARDTVCVNIIVPFDVGVTAIGSPLDHDCADDSIQVLIHVSNLGANDATGIPVVLNITGAATASFNDTITATIPAGTDVVLNMGTINVVAGGIIHITGYTAYINDNDFTNDTLRVNDTIVVAPALPSAINATRCGPGIAVLISSASDSVYWYDAPVGGNLLFTGENYVIPNLSATTTFYTQNGHQCNNQLRRPVTGTINNLPNVNLGADTTAADSLVLNAGPGFVDYLWSNSSTTQTITVVLTNSYSVCVTDSNSCTNCDTISVGIFVGVEQLYADNHIRLFPNPAHSNITLEINKGIDGPVSLIVSNMEGQQIMNEEYNNTASGFNRTWDVSYFAKGVYFLKVKSETGSAVYRLIVQ